MKKTAFILTVIVALVTVTIGFAQSPTRNFDGEKRAEQLKKALNLSDQQEQQLQTLMASFREEMKPVMLDESISREQKQEKMTEYRQMHQAELRKILTEEQVVKLDELMANRPTGPGMGGRPERGNAQRGDNPGRNGRGDRNQMMNKMIEARTTFDAELTLSEKDVIAEYRTILETFRETCPENGEGNSDFHDRGEGRGREPGMRPFTPEEMEPLMEIAKNHKQSLQSIFQEMRPEGEGRHEGGNGHEDRMQMGPAGEHATRGAVRFLLLDPAKAQTGMNKDNQPVFIYPNPASDMVNVQFKNETAQPVKVELFSKSGSIHEVLFESTVPAGTQTYSFKIGHLPVSELYFIKTTIGQEITTVKLLKN